MSGYPKRLRCRAPECWSRAENEEASFSLVVSVGEDRKITTDLDDVRPEHFTCDYCNDVAEEVEESKGGVNDDTTAMD